MNQKNQESIKMLELKVGDRVKYKIEHGICGTNRSDTEIAIGNILEIRKEFGGFCQIENNNYGGNQISVKWEDIISKHTTFLPEEDIAFFKRRDERNDIILERLEFSGKSSFDGRKYLFIEKSKKYTIWDGDWIESYEFFPKFGQLREILGVPFKLSGIDYSYPIFRRRVTWSHWGGALTEKQKNLVLDKISVNSK